IFEKSGRADRTDPFLDDADQLLVTLRFHIAKRLWVDLAVLIQSAAGLDNKIALEVKARLVTQIVYVIRKVNDRPLVDIITGRKRPCRVDRWIRRRFSLCDFIRICLARARNPAASALAIVICYRIFLFL